jgi:K+-transporting ATPase KdpF subunit
MRKFLELLKFFGYKYNRVPVLIFLFLCLNVFLASAVQAATAVELTRTASYAIAFLGLITLSLCIYLCVVIFQPERF